MKTRTLITEINHDDLVELFSTATYNSNWLSIRVKNADYYGTKLESDDDCCEDVWAKVIMNGSNIYVYDFYAESNDEYYGSLPNKWCDEKGCMRYTLSFDKLKVGIERAFNSNDSYERKCAQALLNADDGEFDLQLAEDLMQVILFGEVVYG